MKRHDSDEEGVMRESKDGMWNLHSDLSAHMLKLKEVVEGMEHGAECNAHPSAKYFASKRPDSEFKKDTCNCPRGDLLREIEGVARDGN